MWEKCSQRLSHGMEKGNIVTPKLLIQPQGIRNMWSSSSGNRNRITIYQDLIAYYLRTLKCHSTINNQVSSNLRTRVEMYLQSVAIVTRETLHSLIPKDINVLSKLFYSLMPKVIQKTNPIMPSFYSVGIGAWSNYFVQSPRSTNKIQ